MDRVRRWFLPLLFSLSAGSAWGFGPFSAGGPDRMEGLSVEVSSETLWAEDGSALVSSDLRIVNATGERLEGELRLVPMALNGRIDFERVTVERLPIAGEEGPAQASSNPGFFVLPALRLGSGERRAFRFRIALPPGSRLPNVPLQIFALYRGGGDPGWFGKGVSLLEGSYTPKLDVKAPEK